MSSMPINKIVFYVSVALLNTGAVMAVWLPSMLPLLQPRPVHAAEVGSPVASPSVAVQSDTEKAVPIISGRPTHVTVESVSVDLPVKNGFYDAASGSWTLGYDSAYYATPSVPVNNSNGTTLIYAHNLEGLFAALHRMTLGATLAVQTDTGHTFHYSYVSAEQVAPSAVQTIAATGPAQVILQTCSGNWSEWRTLFTFRLTSVEKHA